MIESVVFSFGSCALLVLVYCRLRRVAADNMGLHLFLAIAPATFLQAVGFVLYGTREHYIDTVSVESAENLMPAASVALFVYVALVAVLTLGWSRSVRVASPIIETLRPKAFAFSVLVCCVSVAAGAVAFASAVGASIGDLLFGSSKWLVMTSSSGGSEFDSNGYLRQLMSLGSPLFLFYFAYVMWSPGRLSIGRIFPLLALFLFAVVPPTILSGRGAVIYVFISMLFILLLTRRMSWKAGGAASLAVLAAFSFLSSLRLEGVARVDLLDAVEQRVFYGGGISIFNTAQILKGVSSEKIDVQLGAAYAGLVTLPVPRSSWPEKPPISYDQLVARQIYGIGGAGAQAIPAGIVGESMINFGVPLGIILAAILTASLSLVQNAVRRVNSQFLNLLLRAVWFPKVIAKLVASGVGFAFMDALLTGIPLLALYYLCIRYRRLQ